MDIHTIGIGVVNRHLVHDQGWILVDTGLLYTQGRVARTIYRLGIRPTDIRLIVLTHGHVDHAGSAHALQQVTGAPIAIHHQDQPLQVRCAMNAVDHLSAFIQSEVSAKLDRQSHSHTGAIHLPAAASRSRWR